MKRAKLTIESNSIYYLMNLISLLYIFISNQLKGVLQLATRSVDIFAWVFIYSDL